MVSANSDRFENGLYISLKFIEKQIIVEEIQQ